MGRHQHNYRISINFDFDGWIRQRQVCMRKKRLFFLTLVAVTSLLCLSLLAVPVSADSTGLTVTPFEAIELDATPGQTITQQLRIALGAQSQAMTIAVDVMGFGTALNGSLQDLTPAQDTSSYSARSFISIDNPSFQLEPGASQNITATITIPANVGDGGRYAIIYIHQELPAGQAGAGTTSAFNIPVLLTIEGSQLTQTGKITGITTSAITSGQPVNILTNFQNTGNIHFKVDGQVTVQNAKGETIGTMTIPLTSTSIIPGDTRQLETTLTSTSVLTPGTYTIDSKVTLADGTVLDESTSTFVVKTNYVAPPAASTTTSSATTTGTTNQAPSLGSINLIPSSSGMLENSDGSIFVSFPQSATIAPVQVSLESYDINQIAALPSGITPASTCFQVEGLTGLLAKNATVNVRYTEADLTAAGGNASKLKLARWDDGTGWTVLKTNVDTGLSTLSATSNQMSIWVVAVGSPASSGISWTVIGIIIAVVIIVAAIIVVLFMTRRKQAKPAK